MSGMDDADKLADLDRARLVAIIEWLAAELAATMTDAEMSAGIGGLNEYDAGVFIDRAVVAVEGNQP
jgi:hypothetical protein